MLAIALILDAIFGEPDRIWQRIPHPAVLMGRLVGFLEQTLNQGAGRRIKGTLAVIAIIIPVWIIARILSLDIFFGVFELIGAAVLLAQRSLMDHVKAVVDALGVSLPAGRRSVAMIVGRDTEEMDETQISRAAIESAAENFSDGVIAPAFWFLLLGLPGMAIYKVVNTADSMIGYRTERFAEFGWAAAKLDDLLNWVPARISAALIVLAGVRQQNNDDDEEDGLIARYTRRFDAVMEEAPAHRSPNAGWPEAATAYSLDIALSGPRLYDGEMTDDLFMNEYGREVLKAEDVERTVALLWRAWGVVLAIVGASTLLLI